MRDPHESNFRKTMMLASLLLLISASFASQGCMSAKQLEAEKAFYDAQAQIRIAEVQAEAETVKAQMAMVQHAAASGKSIIQIFNNTESKQSGMPQYVQKDAADNFWKVLDRGLGIGLPFLGAWGMVREVARNSGSTTNMSNYGANSSQNLSGDRAYTGTTFGNGGAWNAESDLTSTPTVVNPLVVPTEVVRPEVVNPVVVDPVVVEPTPAPVQ